MLQLVAVTNGENSFVLKAGLLSWSGLQDTSIPYAHCSITCVATTTVTAGVYLVEVTKEEFSVYGIHTQSYFSPVTSCNMSLKYRAPEMKVFSCTAPDH